NNFCNTRSNWSKMPTTGWVRGGNGFILKDYYIDPAFPTGYYTAYVAISQNGNANSAYFLLQ
ncbi:MAG: hypothetical protein QG614_5, partial [Patescibacteria group bacterium]|nr:hypothetical protein [Patescibacteria group bacterium]